MSWNNNLNKPNTICCILVFVTGIMILLIPNNAIINNIAFASQDESKFNEDDFMIKDFGMGNDGNPFLTVKGIAGRTVPQEENLGYAYVFVTNEGIYAVSSDWMYTKWHTHELKLDEKNCVESMNMNAGAGADINDAVKVTKTNATKLDKVMTAEFTIGNKDGSVCVTKIFDSAP